MAVVAQVQRWRLLASRLRNYCGRFYTEKAPSRGPVYTTDLIQATVSATSTFPLPVYRVLDASGNVLDSRQDPDVMADTLCVYWRGHIFVL